MSKESGVFARAVVIKVNPGCEVELSRIVEQEVIPRFQKEQDFRGLLAFTLPDGTEALSLSVWDQKARGFFTRSFAALLALARVTLGRPPVQFCEVCDSPLHSLGQVTNPGKDVEATADLRVYQSALRPYQVAPAPATLGRGFPLIWCLINSFHL